MSTSDQYISITFWSLSGLNNLDGLSATRRSSSSLPVDRGSMNTSRYKIHSNFMNKKNPKNSHSEWTRSSGLWIICQDHYWLLQRQTVKKHSNAVLLEATDHKQKKKDPLWRWVTAQHVQNINCLGLNVLRHLFHIKLNCQYWTILFHGHAAVADSRNKHLAHARCGY